MQEQTSGWKSIVGAIAWVLTLQYFFVEAIVQRAWTYVPYSMQHHFISDLGVTVCPYVQPMTKLTICSPLAPLFNASLILNGILALTGVFLLRHVFVSTSLTKIGFYCVAFGTLGLFGVGLVPENESMIVHPFSAFIFFLFTNGGLILLGLGLMRSAKQVQLGKFTLACGLVACAGALLSPVALLPQIGLGLIERIVAYPFTIWLGVVGIVLLAKNRQKLCK